jgi:nucleoside-diphosphate-sugar epimerase
MKKVLVTGGGGFVGSHIVKQLRAMDVTCIVLGRNAYPEVEALGAQCVQGDISDVFCLNEVTKDVDTVFHVAALAGIWGKWEDYHRINVLGTQNVLTAAMENGVRNFIYTSTPSVVFNGDDIVNGDETLPYGKKILCHYARSKIIAEKLVLESNNDTMQSCAIRPHLVWGPGDPHLIPRLLERGRGKELKKVGNCKNLVDISYVDNVATAHILAAKNLENTATAAGKAYFISQGEPVNLWDWIDDLFLRFEVPAIQKRVPFSLAYAAGYFLEKIHTVFTPDTEPKMTRFLAEQLAKSHCFSIKNAKKDLGYIPLISTEEGMKRLSEAEVL